MKRIVCTILCVFPGWAALNVPLTIQEALYPGSTTGVARSNDPVCVGVPIPLSAALTGTSSLGITGASAGQFRVLTTWDGTNAKWVQVCTIATLNAGGTTSVTMTNTGSGNFGGSNLATDNGSTITVATGAATFTIKKANFNFVDQAVAGSTTVVSSGASTGFVIVGPTYPNTTCGTCTTVYSSANDASSTVTVEQNGPVMAVLKATWNYTDGSGNVYMRGTARMYFYVNKSGVKIQHSSRNADYGASNTFASAYKGFQASELRIGANISSPTYTFANHTGTPTTGTVTGSGAYIYEGKSNNMAVGGGGMPTPPLTGRVNVDSTGTNVTWVSGDQFTGSTPLQIGNGTYTNATYVNATTLSVSPAVTGSQTNVPYAINCMYSYNSCVMLTPDTGYVVKSNGSAVQSGTDSQVPEGWGDCSNSSGAGVEMGVYQFAAYYPKSLKCYTTGEARIGIWAAENSVPYYQAWPQYNTHDLFVNFHATTPASRENEFLKFQHYLLARAAYAWYNSTGVFPYALVDPSVEDAFYTNTATGASPTLSSSKGCCIQEFGTTPGNWQQLEATRYWSWHNPGGGNQTEFYWSYLLNWITRGFTGRYLAAAHKYRFQQDFAFPRSDGFSWNSHPSDLGSDGLPATTSLNNNGTVTPGNFNWIDEEHGHWYGMVDFYNMTGDDGIKDQLNDGVLDYYTCAVCEQNANRSGFSYNVTVTGTAVHLNSGTPSWYSLMVGNPIWIGSAFYTVTGYTGPSDITIASPPASGSYSAIIQGGEFNNRAAGVHMMGAARLSQWLIGQGDPTDAATVLQHGENIYAVQVKPPLCVAGYPGGCNSGPVDNGRWLNIGISRERGVPFSGGTNSGDCSPTEGYNRIESAFQSGILQQGILELRNAAGPGWTEYARSLDLAYGISQWAIGPASEMFVDDLSGSWINNGFRYYELIDQANACTGSGQTGIPFNDFLVTGGGGANGQQTVWGHFLASYLETGSTTWSTEFKIALQKLMNSGGMGTSDFGVFTISNLIGILNTPSTNTLSNLTISSFANNGGGSYTIGWTTPASTQYLRVKSAPTAITDWMGFNPATFTFVGNPSTTTNWFAATDAPGIPSPVTGPQSITITGLGTLLTAANFSVKAYAPGIGNSQGAGPATTLLTVSGNGQTGTLGK